MPKRVQVRRWHFRAYFGGDSSIDVEPDTPEREVRAILNWRYSGGNWDPQSLRRGKKYKVRKPSA